MTDKQLIPLRDWNEAAVKREHHGRSPVNVPNGLACPTCSRELVDDNQTHQLLSIPPQYKIHCPACGWMGARFI